MSHGCKREMNRRKRLDYTPARGTGGLRSRSSNSVATAQSSGGQRKSTETAAGDNKSREDDGNRDLSPLKSLRANYEDQSDPDSPTRPGDYGDERTQSGLPPLDFSGEGRKLSGTGGLVSECDYFFMADMRVGQGGEALTSRGSSFPSGASRRSPGLGSRWEDDRDGSKYPSLALSRSPPARRGDYGRREDRFPDSSDLRAIIEEERNRKLGASGWSDMSDDLAYYEKGRGKRDHDESPSRDEKRNKYSRKDDRKTPGARRVLSVAAQELMEEEDDDERGRYVRGSFARKEKEDDGDRHYQNYDLASLPSSREKAVFSRDYDTRDKDPRERQYEGFRRRSLSPLKDRSLDERYDLSSRAGDSDRLDGRYGRSSTPEKWSRSDSPTRPSYREKSREYLRSDSRTSGGRYSNDRDGRLDERYGRDSKRRREDRGRGPYDRDKSAHSDESAASYGVSSAFDVLSEKAVLRASSGEKHLTALELGRPFFGKRRSDLSDRDGSLDRDGKRPEEKAAKTKTSHSSRVGEEDYYDYIYDKRDGKKPSVHVSSRTLDKQDLADDRYPTLYSDRPESYLMDRSSPPPSSAKESKDTSSAKQQDTRNSASLAGEATGVRGRGRGTSPFRGRGRGTAYRARGTAYRGRGTAFRGRGRGGTFVPRGRGRAYRARGFRGSPRGSFVRGRGRGGDMRDSCPPAWVRGGRMRGRNVFAPPGRERRDRDSDDDYSSPDEARKYSSRTSHHRSPERSPSRDRTDDKKRFNRSASREDAKRSPSPEYRLKDGAEDKERFKKSTSREDVKRSRSPEYKPKERTEDKKRSNKSTSKESAKRSPSPEYKPKDRTEDKKRFNKSTSKEDVKRSPSPEYRPRKEPKGYVPRKAKESRTELDTKASEKKVGQNSASSKEADKRDAKDKKKHSAHGKSHSKKAHSKAHRRRRSGSSSSSSSPSSCSCSDSSWSSSSSSSDSDSSDESRSKAKSATKEAGSEQTVGQRKRIVIQLSSKDKRSVVMSGKGKTPIRGKEMDDQESKKVAEKVPGKKDDSASKGNTKGSASSGAVAVSVSGRKRKGPTKPGPARPPGQGAQARMPGPVTHRLNSMSLKQQNKLIESFWALEAEPEEEEPPKELAVKDIKVEKADVDPLYSETQPARQRANDETRQDVKADIRIVVDKRSSREAYHGGQREKYVVGEKAPRTQAKSGKPSKRKVPIRTGEEPSESKAVEAEDYQQLGSTASYNVAAKESAEQQPQVTRRRGSNLISIIPDPNAFAKAAQQRTKLQHKQTAPTRRTASDQSRLAPVEAETRVRHSAALTAHSHRDAGISERTKPQHKHTAPTPRTASVQSRLAPVEDETRVRHLAALTAHSHRDAGISERTKPQRKQTAPTRRTASDQPGLAPVEAQARVRHSAALTSHLRRDSGISERAKIQSEHVNEEVPAQQHYEYGYYGEEQAADHDWGQVVAPDEAETGEYETYYYEEADYQGEGTEGAEYYAEGGWVDAQHTDGDTGEELQVWDYSHGQAEENTEEYWDYEENFTDAQHASAEGEGEVEYAEEGQYTEEEGSVDPVTGYAYEDLQAYSELEGHAQAEGYYEEDEYQWQQQEGEEGAVDAGQEYYGDETGEWGGYYDEYYQGDPLYGGDGEALVGEDEHAVVEAGGEQEHSAEGKPSPEDEMPGSPGKSPLRVHSPVAEPTKPLKSILKKPKPRMESAENARPPTTISETSQAFSTLVTEEPKDAIGQECVVKLGGERPSFFCQLCQCHFNTASAKNLHLKGLKHIEKYIRSKSSLLSSVITPADQAAEKGADQPGFPRHR